MRTVECIVVGGDITGIEAALKAKEAGKDVILIESHSYLGSSLTASMNLWLDDKSTVPEYLQQVCQPAEQAVEIEIKESYLPECFKSEKRLFNGAVKKSLLKYLTEKGIKVLFISHYIGSIENDDGTCGVVIANKWGTQFIPCRELILTGSSNPDNLQTTPDRFSYVIGFAHACLPETRTMPVPEELGVIDNELTFHAGFAEAASLYVEFNLKNKWGLNEAGDQHRKHKAVETALKITGYLFENCDFMDEAIFEQMAAEPKLEMTDQVKVLTASATNGKNVKIGPMNIPMAECNCTQFEPGGWEFEINKLDIPEKYIEKLDETDILIAGGGTGGCCSSQAAIAEEADTIVVEGCSDFGGTKGLGLVLGYYNCSLEGGTRYFDERLHALQKKLTGKKVDKGAERCARIIVPLLNLLSNGGRFYANTNICNVTKEENRVTGLVVASRYGLKKISAKVTIDATGDGDVADYAGAEFTFGDDRMNNVTDFSQWCMGSAEWTCKATDIDVIDQRFFYDFNRGLYLGHVNATWFDFSQLLTVREGRHIVGDVTMTIKDAFRKECRGDMVATAKTEWDPHGIGSCMFSKMGFMPHHDEKIRVGIPYQACLAKGLEGLLVSTKAISATRDAAGITRMSGDIQDLGFSIGYAAVLAAKAGSVRGINCSELTKELVNKGYLQNAELSDEKFCSLEESIQAVLDGKDKALMYVLLQDEDKALPAVQKAYRETGHIELAKAMAWFGSNEGKQQLIEELERATAEEDGALYPDANLARPFIPVEGIQVKLEIYWHINQLLICLGMLGPDKKTAAAINKLAFTTSAGGAPVREENDYWKNRIDIQRVPHCDRLFSLAFALERIADVSAAPAIEYILEQEFISGYCIKDNLKSGSKYWAALSEIMLLAAGLRCGSEKAAQELCEYLDDVHMIYRNFAHAELTDVFGADRGWDNKTWQEYIKSCDELPVKGLQLSESKF